MFAKRREGSERLEEYMSSMMNTILAAALAFGVSTMANAQSDKPETPSIVVTGNGVVRADPDVALVRLGVSSRARTAKDAQAQTNAAIAKFYTALDRLGIERKDIQTSQLTLNAFYNNPELGDRPQIAGYEAENVLTVRITDFAKIGPVVDAGVESGVNNMQGVSFSIVDDTRARLEALRNATREARAKAEAIASALGISLGDVLQVIEGGGYMPPMQNFDSRMAMEMKAGATVSPGQLDVNANVTIRFAIRK
ncbi:MAG: SIMPL domain-containing protein [Armatimonadota bacterium]|nr:SIMPL domain-containing protein [Armatimonadota bacterium]